MHTPFVIRGVIPPLLTPFTCQGEVDEDALRAHVDWLIEKGVHGLMTCGTTGEGPLLTTQERKRVTEVVVETAARRVPVLAHVGAPSTPETIELARHAVACGADAISAVTPYYFRLSPEALVEHYCHVAEAVADSPVFLYNIPQNAGNTISPAVAQEIVARCPNVIGIKDSAGDLAALSAFVGLDNGRFQVVCGSDRLLLRALEAGACASVSGNANVFPEVVVGLFEAFWQGDLGRAGSQQARLDLARQAMGDGNHLGLLKGILELRGLTAGGTRPPLLQATPESIADAKARLQALGLL